MIFDFDLARCAPADRSETPFLGSRPNPFINRKPHAALWRMGLDDRDWTLSLLSADDAAQTERLALANGDMLAPGHGLPSRALLMRRKQHYALGARNRLNDLVGYVALSVALGDAIAARDPGRDEASASAPRLARPDLVMPSLVMPSLVMPSLVMTARIETIFVGAEHRGRGCGSALASAAAACVCEEVDALCDGWPTRSLRVDMACDPVSGAGQILGLCLCGDVSEFCDDLALFQGSLVTFRTIIE